VVILIVLDIILTAFLIWKVSELKDIVMTERFSNMLDKGDVSPDKILKEWFYGGDA
jgi:regulatory protein YycI of two-component signal transduction system YycFG